MLIMGTSPGLATPIIFAIYKNFNVMQITFSPIIFLHTVAFTKSFHFIPIEGHLTICLAQPLKFSFPYYEKKIQM